MGVGSDAAATATQAGHSSGDLPRKWSRPSSSATSMWTTPPVLLLLPLLLNRFSSIKRPVFCSSPCNRIKVLQLHQPMKCFYGHQQPLLTWLPSSSSTPVVANWRKVFTPSWDAFPSPSSSSEWPPSNFSGKFEWTDLIWFRFFIVRMLM